MVAAAANGKTNFGATLPPPQSPRSMRPSGSQPGLPAGPDGALPIDRDFDAAFADELAQLETYNKHHYRPNTYLHKWWARRCGSTFRLILKNLVLDAERRDYYAPGGLEGRVVLDPMMGGGTTVHEAIRLGANVVGVDLDPIPVLQARATLETAFQHLYAELVEALGPLFLTQCCYCGEEAPLRFLLYGARRRCACGPAVLVDSLVLRYEDGRPAVRLCARCHAVRTDIEGCECPPATDKPPLIEKGQTHCDVCEQPYTEFLEMPYYARYAPLVVVGDCTHHGLFFAAPTEADMARLADADKRRQRLDHEPASAFAIEPGPKSRDLVSRAIHTYLDLFSSRQLLYLHEATRVLSDFDQLVRLNLALLVSTSLEFNSMLCGYKGARRGARPGAIRHTFSYHAYSFPYTALENNLLYPRKASGTLEKLFHDRIRRARRWAQRPRERTLGSRSPRFVPVAGEKDSGTEVSNPAALQKGRRRFLLVQGSATALPLDDASVDCVVTDPPYYDNVHYGDLATFFRVWLKQLVPAEAQWTYELAQAAVTWHGDGERYRDVLGDIFAECRRVLRGKEARLIFTFHHWKPQGWTALTLALQQAGFVLVNHYVVHAENPISVHIANLRALTHDAILVLAPTETGTAQQWSRPQEINKEKSALFCRDCATLLGWLLNARLPSETVNGQWRTALK
jgi:putative DNA methylase